MVFQCSVKPWVKPYERANLADEVMSHDGLAINSSYMHHVRQAREGARGAEGGGGGGCGGWTGAECGCSGGGRSASDVSAEGAADGPLEMVDTSSSGSSRMTSIVLAEDR